MNIEPESLFRIQALTAITGFRGILLSWCDDLDSQWRRPWLWFGEQRKNFEGDIEWLVSRIVDGEDREEWFSAGQAVVFECRGIYPQTEGWNLFIEQCWRDFYELLETFEGEALC
jgi:hypothetical protein